MSLMVLKRERSSRKKTKLYVHDGKIYSQSNQIAKKEDVISLWEIIKKKNFVTFSKKKCCFYFCKRSFLFCCTKQLIVSKLAVKKNINNTILNHQQLCLI